MINTSYVNTVDHLQWKKWYTG